MEYIAFLGSAFGSQFLLQLHLLWMGRWLRWPGGCRGSRWWDGPPTGGGSWAIVWVLKQDDENGWRGGCWRHINRGSRRPPVWDRSWIYIALLARQGQKWDTLVRRAPVRDIISRFWRDISVGRESPVRQSGAGAEDSSEKERGRGSAGRFRSQQPPYLVSCHSLTVVLGSCGWFWD